MEEATYKAEVDSYKTEEVSKKLVTFYCIMVTTKTRIWKVERRYNDFLALHSALSHKFKNLPKFPKKTLFKPDLEERLSKLNKYIKIIIKNK